MSDKGAVLKQAISVLVKDKINDSFLDLFTTFFNLNKAQKISLLV